MTAKYGIDSSKTKELAKQLKEAADYLAEHKESGGCYHFHTLEVNDKDINKNVSIVLGWTNGFDENDIDKDEYQDDTWRLAVKVGYQPVNSMMQCDYDVDFNQVYDKETGDIYDSEIVLYKTTDFNTVAEQIVADYNYIVASWKSWAHE